MSSSLPQRSIWSVHADQISNPESLPLRHAIHVAVAGDHPRDASVLFDEPDDFADRSAARRRDVAKRAVADGLELDRVVEIRAGRRDDHEPLVQFDDARITAAPAVE